jgi:hypothetical protein
LLILAGKVVFAHGAADTVEDFGRLPVGVQRLAAATREASRSQDRVDLVHLVGFGDRRKADDIPLLLPEDVADKVVLVQTLHDNHYHAATFVVQPAVEGVVVPVVGGLPLCLGQRLFRRGDRR